MLLAVVIVVNAAGLWPELPISRVDLNDNVLHFTLIQRIVQTLERGENPMDTWSPEWSFGYPVLRTYQPLAHLLVAAVYFALAKSAPLMTVFVWARFLSVVLLPLSFFVAARRLQLGWLTAAASALLAPLVSTNFLYGVEHGSFTWAGSGLFPQAVAIHLFLFALGSAWTAIRQGRRLILTGALVGLTALAHLVYGYMAALSICLLVLMPDAEVSRRVRLGRLVVVGGAAAILTGFQALPLLLDGATINHSRWEAVWKWDSFGAGPVLKWLFTGGLLDHGRLPVLSLLSLASTVLYVWSVRKRNVEPAHTFVLLGAVFWILMFCGRPLWGPLLSLLGVSQDMHLHRVIGGAQVFLVLLAGVAMAWLWAGLAKRGAAIAAVLATAVLLYPAVRERTRNLRNNQEWGRANLAAHAAEERNIAATIAAVQARRGRAFAGLASGWGGSFKIGAVPYYAFLSTAQVPALGFLYHSMALTSDIMVRFNEWNPEHQRLFNIRTVVAPDNSTIKLPPFLKPIGAAGRFRVFDAPGVGYFDIVDVGAAVTTTRRSFYEVNDRWLQSDWVARRVHLLLDFHGGSPSGMPRVYPYNNLPQPPGNLTPAGEIRDAREKGEIYQADLAVARRSYVLFRMTFHKNWKAYLDGSTRPVVMLSPGFMGVEVGPGNHQIAFRYEPERWKPVLGFAGLIAILLLGAAESRGMLMGRAVRLERIPAWFGADTSRRWAIAAGLILLALPVCLPLFTTSLIWGHDAFSYFPRVVEVHQNVTNGILLPRWAPDLERGAGQPLFLFHPPMFYWLAELWRLAGFEFVTGVNLACAIVVLVSAAGMFLLGRLYFGTPGGFLAAAAYLYTPYFATDLYIRSALEEFTAFAFYPLALYGFGAYARYGNRRSLLLGAAAYAGLVLSHLPATLLFSPLLGAFLVWTAWQEKSWGALRAQAGGLVLSLGLSAGVWVPVLLERQYVSLTRAVEGNGLFANHFVYLHQLLYSPWGYGLSLPGPGDGMPFSVGWNHLLLAIVVWVWSARQPKLADRGLIRLFGWAAILLCALTLSYAAPVWNLITPLQYVQLPWRLLGGVAVCGALLVGAFSSVARGLRKYNGLALAGAFVLVVIPNLGHLRPGATQDIDPAFWTAQDLARTGFETTTMRELTPRWMTTPLPYDPRAATVASGVADIRQLDRTPFFWRGEITAQAPAMVRTSIAYFPGWSVRIDGQPAIAQPETGSGLLLFQMLPGTHRVEVSWGNSNPRLAGNTISLIALAIWVFLYAQRGRGAPIRSRSKVA